METIQTTKHEVAQAIVKDVLAEMKKSDEFNTLYVLHYRAGPFVTHMHFEAPAQLEKAIELGQSYCLKRKPKGWRFIQVRPFVNNILEEPKEEIR